MQTANFCAVIVNSGRGSVTVGELEHMEPVMTDSGSNVIIDW